MDLMLDTTTHDLVPVAGDLQLVTKADAVRQHLKQRLWLFLGEWFLDTTKGVPYYQFILVKNPNLDLVEATLKQMILQTPGVLELTDFSFTYARAGRALTVEFTAKCSDEDINFSETVEV